MTEKKKINAQDALAILQELRAKQAAGGKKGWAKLSKSERSQRARLAARLKQAPLDAKYEPKRITAVMLMLDHPCASIARKMSIPVRRLIKWRNDAGITAWKRTSLKPTLILPHHQPTKRKTKMT
jgi:hypothetical protein